MFCHEGMGSGLQVGVGRAFHPGAFRAGCRILGFVVALFFATAILICTTNPTALLLKPSR